MAPRDVASAIRRLVDSPVAVLSLAAGDDYALTGLTLTDEERDLLQRDLRIDPEDLRDRLSTPCLDPRLLDANRAGIFFDAAAYALNGMRQEVEDFQALLVQLAERQSAS